QLLLAWAFGNLHQPVDRSYELVQALRGEGLAYPSDAGLSRLREPDRDPAGRPRACETRRVVSDGPGRSPGEGPRDQSGPSGCGRYSVSRRLGTLARLSTHAPVRRDDEAASLGI